MKIGIIGAGTIVPDFLLASSYIKKIEIKGICGVLNDKTKMENLSKSFKIPKIYFNYDEMLNDDEIDTIYVAVPNILHYSFSLKALEKGKNVICEKPFVVKENEAIQLKETAIKHGLFLFEAISNLYYPNYLKVKELINKLGKIKIVQINYSQYSRRYEQFKNGVILPVFDPKKAGGALMDLNVYNIHFVTGLFGIPKDIMYYANIEKGIDTSGVLMLEYEGMQCVCIAAKDCKAPLSINIQGDEGYIHSESAANYFVEFEYGDNLGNKEKYTLNSKPFDERLYYELKEFCNILEDKNYKLMTNRLNHSIEVVGLLEKARNLANIKFE